MSSPILCSLLDGLKLDPRFVMWQTSELLEADFPDTEDAFKIFYVNNQRSKENKSQFMVSFSAEEGSQATIVHVIFETVLHSKTPKYDTLRVSVFRNFQYPSGEHGKVERVFEVSENDVMEKYNAMDLAKTLCLLIRCIQKEIATND